MGRGEKFSNPRLGMERPADALISHLKLQIFSNPRQRKMMAS